MKTFNPQSTFGIHQKNTMVGQIGQLGTLPYGLETTSAIMELAKIARIIWTFYLKCTL